jgi:hypothetical protein
MVQFKFLGTNIFIFCRLDHLVIEQHELDTNAGKQLS